MAIYGFVWKLNMNEKIDGGYTTSLYLEKLLWGDRWKNQSMCV